MSPRGHFSLLALLWGLSWCLCPQWAPERSPREHGDGPTLPFPAGRFGGGQ